MSDAFAQIARCAERQGGICWLTPAERLAIDGLSTHRGAEMRATPVVGRDLPFLASAGDPLRECRPPVMHLYLHGSALCVCGEKRA